MSKDRRKLLHIHSSVNDKQPTPATLELGELGVNNAKGNAFISTKNSNGEVVRFSEDETIIGWMEQKEVFPYEAYMRGSDNSQVGGVTEQDLLNNKSNLIIKLNQVVPEDTDYSPYDEKVNGAKDIYGNLINPISAGSYKDGAGLAIDMSQYAMIDANPSFSSVTTTCHATLNGTTEIKGKNDGCGSLLDVDVNNGNIFADNMLCESGDTVSIFAKTHLHIGGKDCSNSGGTSSITYERRPKNGQCDIKANTVDGALDEVFDRSKIYMTDTPGTGDILRTYTFIQDSGTTCQRTIGSIDIPKEHEVSAFSLTSVSGDVKSNRDATNWVFNPLSNSLNITAATDVNHLYRNTLNVNYGSTSGESTQSYDPGSGTVNTIRSSNITIPSDVAHLKRKNLTATHNGTSYVYDPAVSSAWTLSHSTLTFEAGEFTANTYNTSDPKTVKVPHGALTINYGSSSVGTFNIHETKTITIPEPIIPEPCNSPLSIYYGDNTTKLIDYYPCSGGSVTIPKIEPGVSCNEPLTIWYGNSGSTANKLIDYYPCTGGEIIIPKVEPGVSCDEPLVVKYGATCSKQATESAYTPCNGGEITIPKALKHLSYTKLDFKREGDAVPYFTYDPASTENGCEPGTVTVSIPKGEGGGLSCNDLENLTVEYGSVCNANNTSYHPCTANTKITIPKNLSDLGNIKKLKFHFNNGRGDEIYDPSAGTSGCNEDYQIIDIPCCGESGGGLSCGDLQKLTINYGSVCNANNTSYHPCTAYTEITIPKYIQDISGGKVHFSDNGCGNDCLKIDSNLCVSGTVVANSFFSSSDRNLKENIESLTVEDLEKARNVGIKSFNFKDDETKRKTYGVIAQEVQSAGLNNIVHTNEEGALSVDYTSLLLLKIASMENTIKELTTRVNILSNRLNFGK